MINGILYHTGISRVDFSDNCAPKQFWTDYRVDVCFKRAGLAAQGTHSPFSAVLPV